MNQKGSSVVFFSFFMHCFTNYFITNDSVAILLLSTLDLPTKNSTKQLMALDGPRDFLVRSSCCNQASHC